MRLEPQRLSHARIPTSSMRLPQNDGTAVLDVSSQVETPAFVIDEGAIVGAVESAKSMLAGTGCRLLYALKALSSGDVMRTLRPHVAGFAASSLFEAELARSVLGQEGSVHITTPGLRPDEAKDLDGLCDYVALNSLNQLGSFSSVFRKASIGVRVNPGLSFVKDARYNPCARNSKLGVPMAQLARATDDLGSLERVVGVHFHGNCDASGFKPLLKTVRRLSKKLDGLLRRSSWVNVGGGYMFEPGTDPGPLHEAIALLRDRYNFEVFAEPGAALVRRAGHLVASVIDIAKADSETLVYLDTSVNHMPEVYEYQFEPDVIGHTAKGKHWYTLVGSTCLAGDRFGRYAFDEPLCIGSRVVFSDMGAYTAVKAQMFNGVNRPTMYYLTTDKTLTVRKRFTYNDFAGMWGEEVVDASL